MSPHFSAGSARPVDAPRADVADALLRLRATAPEYLGSGWSGAPARGIDPREPVHPRDLDRDRAAVTRSLGWAQESADRGDYLDALGWVAVVEEIGAELPGSFQTKRRTWSRAVAAAEREERDARA